MESILEKGIRQLLRRVFGPDVEAFILDDNWQGLLFVPDIGADRRVAMSPAPAADTHFAPWPYAGDGAPVAAG